MFDKILDTSGLNCPLPILHTKKNLNLLEDGEILKVISTDKGYIQDIKAFCENTNNELISSTEENQKNIFFIKKG